MSGTLSLALPFNPRSLPVKHRGKSPSNNRVKPNDLLPNIRHRKDGEFLEYSRAFYAECRAFVGV